MNETDKGSVNQGIRAATAYLGKYLVQPRLRDAYDSALRSLSAFSFSFSAPSLVTIFAVSFVSLLIVRDLDAARPVVPNYSEVVTVYMQRGDNAWGSADFRWFKRGHRCLEYRSRLVSDPEEAGVFFESVYDDGTTIRVKKVDTYVAPAVFGSFVPKVGMHKVCTKLLPNSDKEPLAKWRRNALLRWLVGATGSGLYFSAFVIAIPLSLACASAIASLGIVRALIVFLQRTTHSFVRGAGIIVRNAFPPTTYDWPQAERLPKDQSQPLLVFMSDLHLSQTRPYEVQEDPSLQWPGRTSTVERFTRLLHHAALAHPHVPIVLGGDITDLGRAEEWKLLERIVAQVEERIGTALKHRVHLVPGNHDLSINMGNDPDITFPKNRDQRVMLFRTAQRAFGARPELDLEEMDIGSSIPSLISRNATVLFLNSCLYPSRFVLSNAVGAFGRAQIAALRQQLKKISGPVVLVSHHHVSRPKYDVRTALDWIKEVFLIATDSRQVLRLVNNYSRDPGNSCLIVHGHRHRELFQKSQAIRIYGHPSSTMGNVSQGAPDGVMRYATITFSDGAFAVDSVELHEVDSPILELEDYLRSVAAGIAPERAADLDEVVAAKNLHVEITDEIREISIHLASGRVRMGLTSLEHLWSAALFYYCLYSDYADAQRDNGLSTFDTSRHPRTNESMNLLNWATRQWQTRSRTPWPSTVKPTLHPVALSDPHIANELFMAAVAWTLHHEIAHARLEHPARELVNSALEEKDADLAATDWIFGQAPSDKHLKKRALGVIVAILALDVLEYAQDDPPATSHPRAYERLAYCMNRYALSEEDEAFAFALCGMQFNLQQRGIAPPLDSPTFRRILDECFFARAVQSRGIK